MRWIALFVFLFGVSIADASLSRQPDRLLKPLALEKERKPPDKQLAIAENCEIIIDGKKSKIEDLKEGMEATFTIENGVIIRIIVVTKKE